jgi:2-amino-4-hydroxy-6-hydroxymethyldihydropteridine diphosphokinase
MPDLAYVALGSNMGDRARFLSLGRERLSRLPNTRLLAESSIEETEPIGPEGQGRYLNQMVLLETALSPPELLRHCHEIEQEAERDRKERWGARTLDLDIVRYADRVSTENALKLPHPEIKSRAFWQREIAELEQYV